jgi:hypothetical protein
VTDFEVEQLADSILQLFRLTVPVDLGKIAAEEGIELVAGQFGSDFHGRIEYLPDERVFAIYHPEDSGEIFPGRIRFTVAHELGHFFIPEHREILLRDLVHNSTEDFRSSRQIEREADRFASALLIPGALLKEKMGRRRFLSLKEISEVAGECRTSLQAAAFRYTQFTGEPYVAIISENQRVLYYFTSEEANALGFGGLGIKTVPAGSPAVHAMQDETGTLHEGETNTEAWFSERSQRADLWEESVNLGYDQRVLTLLSWPNYEADD